MKKRYILRFPPKVIEFPLIYNLIKKYDIKINILKADVSPEAEGHLLIEMEGTQSNIQKGIDFIKVNEVNINPIEKNIFFEKTLCVNCGACTAVCFPSALTMDRNTWELIFEPDKCVVCQLCIKACPLQLFKIDF